MWAYMWSPADSELIQSKRKGDNFYAVGEHIKVTYVDIMDVRKIVGHDICDGEFNGHYNQAYELTDAQKDEVLAINAERARQARCEKINKDIKYYEKLLAGIKKLYTKEEADALTKAYNDKYNEGGYGYVPHYYTYEEYDNIKNHIDDYKAELKMLIVKKD